ncbi:MAG: glycosyl hydrolase 108 family protein [Limnochordia bacterium]
MDERFLVAVEVVLTHEGGYTNNPADPGGETNYGISKRSYPQLDIKALTREQAVEIYRQDWWEKYRYGDIAVLAVATKVFDLSVNMGPAQGHRILQRAVNFVSPAGLKVDGILGPKTITATNAVTEPEKLLQMLRYKAAEYYYSLVKKRKEAREFLLGWLNRAYY